MNALLTIRPYKHNGTWVFDDPDAGLVREPFVCGVPEMIDRMVADVPGAARGFRLVFSGGPFPGSMVQLDWLREEIGGNWYAWREGAMEGWLCPALFKYFEAAPPRIYARVEAVEDDAVITAPRAAVERLLAMLEAGDLASAVAGVRAILASDRA